MDPSVYEDKPPAVAPATAWKGNLSLAFSTLALVLASIALARTFSGHPPATPPATSSAQSTPAISAGPPIVEPAPSRNQPSNATAGETTTATAQDAAVAVQAATQDAEPEAPAASEVGAAPEYLTRVRAGRHALERMLLPRARAEFRRALEIKPDGVEAQIGLAWVSLRIGYYAVAARSFRRLYAQGHSTPEVRAGLGLAHAKLREREPATRYLRAYLASHPQGPFAPEARRALGALGAG